MREIGRWEEAERAYVAALGGYPRPPASVSAKEAGWCHELSVVLDRRSEPQPAFDAAWVACGGDAAPREWLLQLRRAARALENHPGIAVACRGLRRLGDDRPSLLWELAAAYEALGHWERAHEAVTSFLRARPDHRRARAAVLRLAGLIVKWRGTFSGDFLQPTYRPIPESDLHRYRHMIVTGLERQIQEYPHRMSLQSALAEARFAVGDYENAAGQYRAALRAAADADGTWVFAVKHRWQHRMEAAYAAMGAPRVDDPHFACSVEHSMDGTPAPHPVAGLFTAKFTYSGLHISGMTTEDDEVMVFLDDLPVRRVRVDPSREFVYIVDRASLPAFPVKGELRVATVTGDDLTASGGGTILRLTIPHGQGSVVPQLKTGRTLDKKGAITPSDEEIRRTHEDFLALYDRVGEFFDTELGIPLFAIYGTLLGFHRDGGFITGDDDFDCAWVTDADDPQQAKEQAIDVMVRLVKAGFAVSFNRRGRLFRVASPDGGSSRVHLDVHPIWFSDGYAWLHNNCRFPADRDAFLPVSRKAIQGVDVRLPAQPARFLQHHYGANWETPDPGFTYYLDSTDPAIMAQLSKALITPAEYRQLLERLSAEAPDAVQRLTSVGSPDFYPLPSSGT